MEITIRDLNGKFSDQVCTSMLVASSGLRDDKMALIDHLEFKEDSIRLNYYGAGGESTNIMINTVPFNIPNVTEFCSQSTNCIKADLNLPFATQDSFQSSKSIISEALLPLDMKLLLKAKTAVELNEGFEVGSTSLLKVLMEDCTPPSSPGN